MIDLHTHILPNVDDGSSSLEESLALLRMLASQGVTLTAATPHFYAASDKPEQFFLRRESAWQQLSAAMESGMPCVLLGAEVAFYRNISQMQQLERFCIGSSRLLLIEMPFEPWSERVLAETLEISERGIQVVFAHVERYFRFQRADMWQRLSDRGIYMQTNANALLALRADEHHVAGVDGGFLLDDAARHALLARLLMLGGNRNAFHDDLAGLRGSNQNLAFLALLGTDMHILLPLLTELREPETRSS